MHDIRKDITAVIEPEAASAGLSGRRAVAHLFAQLRGTGPRLLFFSCSYAMTTTEEERQMSYDGINRAIAGVELALELVAGDGPINGVHPDNLIWFRDILDSCPGSRKVLGKFATRTLALRDPAQFEPDDLRRAFFDFIPFAAGPFNEHFVMVNDLTLRNLEQTRLQQKRFAMKSTKEAQTAMTQIDWISRSVRLISLNASVEAARAGTHGSGFGVIAGEIRQLSDEISTASAEVRHGLTSLLQQIEA